MFLLPVRTEANSNKYSFINSEEVRMIEYVDDFSSRIHLKNGTIVEAPHQRATFLNDFYTSRNQGFSDQEIMAERGDNMDPNRV